MCHIKVVEFLDATGQRKAKDCVCPITKKLEKAAKYLYCRIIMGVELRDVKDRITPKGFVLDTTNVPLRKN